MIYLRKYETLDDYYAERWTIDYPNPSVTHIEETYQTIYEPQRKPDSTIRTTFYVSDTSRPTTLLGYNGEYYFESVEIDGMMHSVVTEYQFDYTGEHTVNFKLKGNYMLSMYQGTFEEVNDIVSIIVPDSVKTIYGYVARNCSGLTSITIGNNVRSVRTDSFYDCPNIASITVSEGNTTYDSRDYCNAIIETETNKLIMGCSNSSIPNGVVTIGKNAFQDSSISELILPSSVTNIEYSAFMNCDSLSSVTIPDSVESLGGYAFANCSNLESVSIGSGLTSIGSVDDEGKFVTMIFVDCPSLTSITVDSNNTTYDSRNDCNAIIETATNKLIQGCNTTVIPSSVEEIGDSSFMNCAVTDITLSDNVTVIGNEAFSSCMDLTG